MKATEDKQDSRSTTASATDSAPPESNLATWGVVAVVLIVIGLIFGFVPRWLHHRTLLKERDELSVLNVEVTNAVAGVASASLLLSAEVRPYEESPIYARASGFLKKWYVDIGAPVKAGVLLADIDAPELEQQLTGAKAELVQSEAAEALARITAARWAELLKTSSVSEQENAEKQADLKLKIATVDASKANVHRLEDIQSFTHVLAPFDGTVTLRATDVGDLINSGKELFRLADTTKLRVFVRVPQTATPGIAVGMDAEMLVPELPTRKFTAKVVRTAGAIDPVSRTLLTELEVENPKNEVLAGSYAQVSFSDLKQTPPIVLPSNTLLFRGDGIQAGVVGPDNKVQLRTLTVGRDFGKTLEIIAGVATNEQVIVNPPDSLVGGAVVRIANRYRDGAEEMKSRGVGIIYRSFKRFDLGLSVAALSVACAAGCAVGPDYKPPQEAVPGQFSGAGEQWKLAAPADNMPKGDWWSVFADTNLDALEKCAATNNQNLIAAVAVFEEARATVGEVRAGYYPQIAFSPYLTRERDSANRPVSSKAAGAASTYNTFSLPLDASYEVDLWGRVRREVESAKALAAADAADLESVKLSIQAEVAEDYFRLHALDEEIALLRSSLEVFEKSLELTRNRRAGGIATDLDVAQAETVLRTTETQLPVTLLQRVRLQHALAVLTGRQPTSFVEPERIHPFNLPLIPTGLPSEFLERRPDVAAAERRMASANADVGVAKSAFFPAIQINGMGGLESVTASSLFNASSRMWSVGPAVTLPIFQGGRLRSELRRSVAAHEEETARYRHTVLNAFRDVEDNLAAEQLLVSEHTAQDLALESAKKTLDIANNRYRAGLVTYLEVATAQNAELDIERASVRLRGQQLATAVGLIKSLGGGWNIKSKSADSK